MDNTQTACDGKHRCTDVKAKWCIGYVETYASFEFGDDTCKYVGRKGMCTNRDAWPKKLKKAIKNETV